MIFYARYFLYKPLFPASQPFKTLKIESAISKSTWGTTYSSFRPEKPPKTTRTDQKTRQKSTYVDLCFLYEPILGPLKARFDQLDRWKIKEYSYLSYLRIFISIKMLHHEKTRFKTCLFFLFAFFLFCFFAVLF